MDAAPSPSTSTMPPSTRPMVTAIVAATTSNGIGLNGGLPWRLPGEMKYFARVTTGSGDPPNAVVMGRKTWDGIPAKFRPLKGRKNLVISRQGLDVSGSADTSSHPSLESALSSLPTPTGKVFLIGGSQLYSLGFGFGSAPPTSSPLVDRVLLTRVLSPEYECDTFLDDFTAQTATWEQASHEELCAYVGFEVDGGEIEEKGTRYRFEMWKRRDVS